MAAYGKDIREALERVQKQRGARAFLNLKQPTKAPNGKHRRTSPKAHRDPVDGASQGITIRTGLPPASWRTYNFATPGGISWLEPRDPGPKPIPYAGIRTGEIIAHRAWLVIEGELSSLAHYRPWLPGETVHGDLKELVSGNNFFSPTQIWGGVYAFRDRPTLFKDTKLDTVEENAKLPRVVDLGKGLDVVFYLVDALIIGTVKLWGEVVEHELGYRAEYAKLVSLDTCIGEVDFEALKAKYHV